MMDRQEALKEFCKEAFRDGGEIFALQDEKTTYVYNEQHDGQTYVFFWSDSLRLELWNNGSPTFLTVPTEVWANQMLQSMYDSDVLLALNWGDGQYTFTPKEIQEERPEIWLSERF